MTPVDPLAVAALIADILEELGVRYAIGGSVAASLFGELRSTLDLDVMVDLDEPQVGILKASEAILDFELMRRSARERQIDDLLGRAIAESKS